MTFKKDHKNINTLLVRLMTFKIIGFSVLKMINNYHNC